ncbi:hypothetical protein DPMN_056348 [Dreissena polymorpha]|uniref:Uncharacterized protein n=1 Tax=Dreissena polymorpha TaxID=45954 RepID=A0A9D4CTA1_DREPO|nr:hypothetical protein DPMN_056348 [Dreissena polymorpha]
MGRTRDISSKHQDTSSAMMTSRRSMAASSSFTLRHLCVSVRPSTVTAIWEEQFTRESLLTGLALIHKTAGVLRYECGVGGSRHSPNQTSQRLGPP